ncbi:MAG: L,D-transpeptidase [Clostridia bacterium]|nr:L,D-transpeptidase [Clostridia bacterium]
MKKERVTTKGSIVLSLLLTAALTAAFFPSSASAKKLEKWLEGFQSGENWFGENFSYDITDSPTCWELLQRPVTVLNVGEREVVYPLKEPGGKAVNKDKLGGCIAGATAAVHVLGEDENGWTLIEGLDGYDRLIRGYVRTKLLKTVNPNEKYGIIIDKLYQRLYLFIDGTLFSECSVSTGIPTDDEPYNETASGEYLISSWVGAFTNEDLICEKALRFNNGDLLHEVPYQILADGTKRYSKFEERLGQKASHGCIRVARIPNAENVCQTWLWNNLKKNTKVIIWDDDGRKLPYPAGGTPLYYNPQGGQYYHADAECNGVKVKYRPLTAFTYGELEEKPYQKLGPCPFCVPVKRIGWIDEFNKKRGFVPEPDALESLEGAVYREEGPAPPPVEIVIISPQS